MASMTTRTLRRRPRNPGREVADGAHALPKVPEAMSPTIDSAAPAQELPLVGGGEHDWAYLLGHLGRLTQDQSIGHTVWKVGVLVYVVSIVAGLWALTTPSAVPVSDDGAGSAVGSSEKLS